MTIPNYIEKEKSMAAVILDLANIFCTVLHGELIFKIARRCVKPYLSDRTILIKLGKHPSSTHSTASVCLRPLSMTLNFYLYLCGNPFYHLRSRL